MIKLTLSRFLTIINTAIAIGMGFITLLYAFRAGNTSYIVLSAVVLGIETLLLQFLITDAKKNKKEEKEEEKEE